MKKLWKIGLAAGGAAIGAAAAAVGTAYGAAKLFVSEALDREEPALIRRVRPRMLSLPSHDPLLDASAAAAEQLRAAETERVEISAFDGVKLAGHLRRCEGEPRRVILAMHGWRSSWCKDFGGISDFWRDNGCAVLYAEQRGQGESGGDAMGFGLLECRDCLAWVEWLNRTLGTEQPVYLAGISMGATTVLMAAGLTLPENVRGVMADCGFISADAIWRHVSQNSWHLPYGPFRRMVERVCREKIRFTPDAANTLDAMARTRVPVLFIHGLDDSFVPASMSEQNYDACAAPGKRIFLVPGAGHGMSYLVDREGYEAQVKEFWSDCES